MASIADLEFKTESYSVQKKEWPEDGKHILAQFDDEFILVYQAFKESIAKYAVENQRLGGPDFLYGRISWIKSNFLSMMYLSTWGTRVDQERVLAICLRREHYDEILNHGYTRTLRDDKGISRQNVQVVMNWDPDHKPKGAKCKRQIIRLGLKGDILKKFGQEWIVSIKDITDFVREQKEILDTKGEDSIQVAKETVYPQGAFLGAMPSEDPEDNY